MVQNYKKIISYSNFMKEICKKVQKYVNLSFRRWIWGYNETLP